MLGAGALGRPRGMVWGGRREEGSGWGARVYLWQIHFDIWQNQYNTVKLKNKIKMKKKLIYGYLYNWITLLGICNIVSQLYFNKIYILKKKACIQASIFSGSSTNSKYLSEFPPSLSCYSFPHPAPRSSICKSCKLSLPGSIRWFLPSAHIPRQDVQQFTQLSVFICYALTLCGYFINC